MSLSLDDVLLRLRELPAERRKEVQELAIAQTAKMRWVPNPGPQTTAYYCEAEQLLYGGEAGGGKTDLLIGLATQAHQRSLLLRRINKDVSWLVDRSAQILETRKGFNGQDDRWTLPDGRVIDFAGCQHPGDEQRNKGRPKDLIGFDEASDFLEQQVEFILGWLRSTEIGQRCRSVFATNPPTSAEGEWIVRWFAPWVDPAHPLYPYPMGKLLYTCRGPEDEWLWFEEPRIFVETDGGLRDATADEIAEASRRQVHTVSRTFIRSGLGDNPDLARTNYRTQLQMLPEELRRRYERGDFTAGAEDDEFQVIPTEWIRAAQDRWRPDGGSGAKMVALGVDVAQGGKDNTVFAPRYSNGWFAELHVWKGIDTKDGPSIAGRVFQHIRDNAQVNIDLGGGWGGSPYDHIKVTDVSVLGVVPSEGSQARTADGRLGFKNKRAEITWKFREALDPNAKVALALPPGAELRADLASYRWKPVAGGVIQIEMKENIKKRLLRSPDRGDAVILAHASGSSRVIPDRHSYENMQTHAKVGHAQVRRRR